MTDASDWRPCCSRSMLQQRAALRAGVRQFFTDRGYLEVDTPLLSRDIVIDAHLNPVEVQMDGRSLYLQTSPEAAMKRLLAADSGSIFQITSSFRGDERGALHNPEFCIVEWYGVGDSWRDQLTLTENLVRTMAGLLSSRLSETLSDTPFRVTTYQDAFHSSLGIDVLDATQHQLQECAGRYLQTPSPPDDRDELLNLLLATEIEPQLGADYPEFLIDYPVSQAALAAVSEDDARVARRFELYIGGVYPSCRVLRVCWPPWKPACRHVPAWRWVLIAC